MAENTNNSNVTGSKSRGHMASSDARLDTPTFHRNHAPILSVMRKHLSIDTKGTALEIGSGSGQHILGFAAQFPNMTWLPSDPDARHRDSIDAWRVIREQANVNPPIDLDVSVPTWSAPGLDGVQAIVCINVLHIAPWAATIGLLTGAGRWLTANSPLFIYGPFKQNGQHTAESNVRFDNNLRERNPQWGVRDLNDIEALAEVHDLHLQDVALMPANNFTLVFRRRT